MGEPYAIRIGSDGKRHVYQTKKDYEYGKLSSFGRAGKHAKGFL